MYDIVTLEPHDPAVAAAVGAILSSQTEVPAPGGDFRYFTPAGRHVEGDGGTRSRMIVVVARASGPGMGGCRDWPGFRAAASREVDWANARTVFLMLCDPAGLSTAMERGGIVRAMQSDLAQATVWAACRGALATR